MACNVQRVQLALSLSFIMFRAAYYGYPVVNKQPGYISVIAENYWVNSIKTLIDWDSLARE